MFNGKDGGDTKPELRAHFEEWGWIAFLTAMAETKVFDIPGSGLDSIECTKKTKAYKVLLFASEKKEYSIALSHAYKVK